MKNFVSALAGMALGLFVQAAAWAQSVFVASLSSSQAQIGVNGPAPAYVITLASVQVGEIGLLNVPAMVIEGGQEKLPTVLIGMSFLKHVEMRRTGQSMTLTRAGPR